MKTLNRIIAIIGFFYFSYLVYEAGGLFGTEGFLRTHLAFSVTFGYCMAFVGSYGVVVNCVDYIYSLLFNLSKESEK